MSMQSVLMARPAAARWFMSTMPPSFHEKNGRKLAEATLRTAIRSTKAYPEHLRRAGLDPDTVMRSPQSVWDRLPILDKKSYVEAYPLESLVRDGMLTTGYTVEKSSGLSGRCNYWFRTPEEDAAFPAYLEFAFRQFFGIEHKRTLIIIGLALGTWTSGEKMAQALREVAASGKYPLTIATPGHKGEEIIELCRDLSPHYEQTIIVGYPPFIKHVIDEGLERGIDWRALGVKIGLGGEGYSEEWRDRMASVTGIDIERDFLAISGGFGAADLGMSIGREYPLTVMVRRLARSDRDLARALFGEGLPMLFQYSPSGVYIEQVDDELVFTVPTGIPLVRYNIHDRGGLIGFDRLMEILGDFGYDAPALLRDAGYEPSELWKLPLFYCYGRSDGTVILAGVNIHPDAISAALSMSSDTAIAGHKIRLEQDERTLDSRLVVALEHKEEVLIDPMLERLAQHYATVVVDGLRATSSEYTNLHDTMPERALPIVKVYPRGTGPFAADTGKMKRKYTF